MSETARRLWRMAMLDGTSEVYLRDEFVDRCVETVSQAAIKQGPAQIA
jgi:hypothetical protein